MTSDLWCAPHVHLAMIDEDVIVLDLLEDQYDCLVDAALWLTAGEDGDILVRDPVAAAALQEAGIAVHGLPPPLRRPRVRPKRDLSIPAHPPRFEILRALVVLARATAVFRKKSLIDLVQLNPFPSLPDSSQSTERGAFPEDEVAVLLAAARHARPWVPFEGECLQRAFQLRYYLAHRGIATDWVFGVRTWPFSAHCWLQVDDLVIGDRLERVSRYTPIMTA